MADKVDSTIIIGPVRLSYLSVFKPRKNDLANRMEYSCVLLIPKNPTQQCPDPQTTLKTLAGAIKGALATKFQTPPPKWDNPLKNGDEEVGDDGEPKHPGFWFIRTWCNEEYPPVLVDARREMVTPGMGWKSGDWAKVQAKAWCYDQKGNKGVSLGLRAIQFLYVDEGFGDSSDPVAVAGKFDVEDSADMPTGGTSRGNSNEYDPFADE